MKSKVTVELDDRSYDISVITGVEVSHFEAVIEKGRMVLILSDSNVDPLYGDKVEKMIKECGSKTVRMVVPAGEKSKCLATAEKVYEKCVSSGLDRKSYIVALGGGMIGDLAGFISATFLRGIRFIQVPTTLLAMVDSSVGGKTGVNLASGKNMVGVFHQPSAVLTDLSMLTTLANREYISGMAEVVKYGIIWDSTLFRKIEDNVDAILKRETGLLAEIIARCCEIKAEVVAVDEREAGVRAILNLGHTFGHALEQLTGYSALLHGEAISIGMVFAVRLSVLEKGFKDSDAARVEALLSKLGLPTGMSAVKQKYSLAQIGTAMEADKKSVNKIPKFVLVHSIGEALFGCDVKLDDLKTAYGLIGGGSK